MEDNFFSVNYVDGRLVKLSDSLVCVFPPDTLEHSSKISFYTFDDGSSCFLIDEIYRVVVSKDTLEYLIENPVLAVVVVLNEPEGNIYAKEVARFFFKDREIDEFRQFLISLKEADKRRRKLDSMVSKLREKGLSKEEIEEIINELSLW